MRLNIKIRFIALTIFSQQGGIEKFNRAFIRACSTILRDVNFKVCVLYDRAQQVDDRYINRDNFEPGNSNRLMFVLKNWILGLQSKQVVLGHINLALIGVAVKLFSPKTEVWLICHGIEVFTPLKGIKRKILQKADRILAVSTYTRNHLIETQGVDPAKVHLFPNTIDPFFQLPAQFQKPAYLQSRYGINAGQKVLFTLTRLNSREGYKGYDTVIEILPSLISHGEDIKYIIAGKADESEANRIKLLIQQLNLENRVVLAGFLPDHELTDHFLLADLFVMPSKGEGFGIVFIEAMACGLPVVAGNKDGSTEALQFGKLGKLVNPDDREEMIVEIKQLLQLEKQSPIIQSNMLHYFSFEKYMDRMRKEFESHH